MTETVAPVTVQTRKPVVIAPPLDGPNWLDGNSCCDMTAHRMAMNPLNGQLWAAERFAIDYVQLDDRAAGCSPATSPSRRAIRTSAPIFTRSPTARWSRSLDGLPEQVPGRTPTGLPLDQYGGNHIVQDIGDGNYAFYAHLKTGSVKVKAGDRAYAPGRSSASLGNTGNTDAPHLHFHVMSTPDPLASNGLPFVFSSFKLDSACSSRGRAGPADGRRSPRRCSPASPPATKPMSAHWFST